MIKKHILFLLILFSTSAFSQKAVVFSDDFSNNKNEWYETENKTYSTKVADGFYTIDRKAEKNSSVFKQQVFIDQNDDFDIEMRFKQNSGIVDHGFGLLFGYSDIDNFYTFIISGNGHYRLTYYDKNVFTKIVNWTKFSSKEKMGKLQTLSFKQNSGKWKFYLDGELLCETPQHNFFGSYLGFSINNKMSVSVDYLKVKQNSNTINLIKNPVNGYKLLNLGENINTKYSERTPVISADGQLLYFVSEGDADNTGGATKTEIFFSKKEQNGTWGKRINVGSPLNNTGNNSVVSISADNNQLLTMNTYNELGKPNGGGISESYKTDKGWIIPTTIKIDDYYNDGSFAGYSLSADGNILVMSVTRSKDTHGGEDLYVSFKKKERGFTKPLNLGTDINSFLDDFTPFLAADNKTLYFSTYGQRGYGSADIFVSRRQDSTWTKWSKPENLGPEINGKGWDAYLSVEASGKLGYLVSGENSIGDLDIFSITLPKSARPEALVLIKGKVLDKKTNKPLATKIAYYDLSTNKLISTAISDPINGDYSLTLPAGRKYSFLAIKDKYFSISENLDVLKVSQYTEINKDLFLVPIKKDAIVRLNNIFFDTNKAKLKKESHPELSRLVEMLKKYPKMKIEIQGHTDNVGSDASNLALSEKRASSVFNFLVNEKGIDESRLISKGYGEKVPIKSNQSTLGRAKNRRVDFKIISK